MGSVRAAVMEFLSGGEGADSSALDAAQAAQQRAFVRGLLPGIGHQGPVPSQPSAASHPPAPPPAPPQADGDAAGVYSRPSLKLLEHVYVAVCPMET